MYNYEECVRVCRLGEKSDACSLCTSPRSNNGAHHTPILLVGPKDVYERTCWRDWGGDRVVHRS